MPSERQTPENVVAWLKSRIVSNGKYVGSVRQKNRCIRITFSKMFHLDVVAARGDTRKGAPIVVPDRDLGQWVKSHPKGYTVWVNSRHQSSGNWLKSTVKMVKWWRNLKVGEDSAPKSIVLQTLVGHRIPSASSSHAHAVVTTLESLWELLGRLAQVPRVMNPSMPDENLARDWGQEGFERFKEHLQRAARLSRQALDHKDLDRSIDIWRELFGERFPVNS